jgi:hypothetical protein
VYASRKYAVCIKYTKLPEKEKKYPNLKKKIFFLPKIIPVESNLQDQLYRILIFTAVAVFSIK